MRSNTGQQLTTQKWGCHRTSVWWSQPPYCLGFGEHLGLGPECRWWWTMKEKQRGMSCFIGQNLQCPKHFSNQLQRISFGIQVYSINTLDFYTECTYLSIFNEQGSIMMNDPWSLRMRKKCYKFCDLFIWIIVMMLLRAINKGVYCPPPPREILLQIEKKRSRYEKYPKFTGVNLRGSVTGCASPKECRKLECRLRGCRQLSTQQPMWRI